MSGDSGKTTELWAYAGVRLGSKGRRCCAWVDPSDCMRKYIERSADHVIGARYKATVERDGDKVALFGTPEFEQKPDRYDPKVAQWAAADRIAKTRLARLQMERSAARVDALEAALAPIEELAASYRNGADLDALVAYVSRRIHHAYFTRMARAGRKG
jgi:hypothetical protein